VVRRAALIGTVLVLASGAPASAVEIVTINSTFSGFQPAARVATLGEVVRWNSNDSVPHTATGRQPLGLWNREIPAGSSASRAFRQSGVFPYLCTIHPSMTGVIRVPVIVTPAEARRGRVFTVRAGSGAPPPGFRYVIQRRRPNQARFSAWRTISTATTSFTTNASTPRGTWRFRSRLLRVSNGAVSGFSPVDTARVT
jgi:plastocyanin